MLRDPVEWPHVVRLHVLEAQGEVGDEDCSLYAIRSWWCVEECDGRCCMLAIGKVMALQRVKSGECSA